MKKILFAVSSFCMFSVIAAAPAFARPALYTNGLANLTVGSYGISFGSSVSDSFVLSQNSTVTGAVIGLWLWTDDAPLSVNWSITSDPFGGTTYGSGTSLLTNDPLGTPGRGSHDYYDSTLTIASLPLAGGTYWLQLQNVVSSQELPVGWDNNGGPSEAYNSGQGPLADLFGGGSNSESFSILGSQTIAPTPEPSSLVLLGTGVLGFGGMLRRRLSA